MYKIFHIVEVLYTVGLSTTLRAESLKFSLFCGCSSSLASGTFCYIYATRFDTDFYLFKINKSCNGDLRRILHNPVTRRFL